MIQRPESVVEVVAERRSWTVVVPLATKIVQDRRNLGVGYDFRANAHFPDGADLTIGDRISAARTRVTGHDHCLRNEREV